jgi:hypothetical protein
MLNSTFISLLKESLKEDDVSGKKIYKIFFSYRFTINVNEAEDRIYFDFERKLTPEEVKKFADANIRIGPKSDQSSPIKDEDLYMLEYNKKESEKQDLHIHLLLLSKSEFDKLKSDISGLPKDLINIELASVDDIIKLAKGEPIKNVKKPPVVSIESVEGKIKLFKNKLANVQSKEERIQAAKEKAKKAAEDRAEQRRISLEKKKREKERKKGDKYNYEQIFLSSGDTKSLILTDDEADYLKKSKNYGVTFKLTKLSDTPIGKGTKTKVVTTAVKKKKKSSKKVDVVDKEEPTEPVAATDNVPEPENQSGYNSPNNLAKEVIKAHPELKKMADKEINAKVQDMAMQVLSKSGMVEDDIYKLLGTGDYGKKFIVSIHNLLDTGMREGKSLLFIDMLKEIFNDK